MATDSTSASRGPARPSSSTSELFGGIYARGAVAAEVCDAAWLRAMLDVEAALARACVAEGLIAASAGDAIVAACRPEGFDIAALGVEGAQSASPVVALARILRERAGEQAHHGATSQDIMDTAMMLVARRALAPLLADAGAAADACARLAETHRETPIMARTLLAQALPTSFGLKAAVWMSAVDEARAGLAGVRERALAVQMGGPVGHRDPAIGAHVARDLGLTEPVLAWHVVRVRPAALAAGLATLAGVLAKIARDVTLLAQDEVGEVREGGEGRGASSAMAHKRNPVAAVSVLACAQRVPALAGTILGSMAHEHERAAGAWQAEWGTITELLRLTGSAAAWARDLLEHLEVDADRMRLHAGESPDLGSSGKLIDRALAAHRP
ncbi:MAG: 3-carboxy-cis,cis-muconate cycloisomerase [Solirubrobacteraceae bacterium]|nr:3-carboxy-cis,cis-muconate cycloisomerase [Solirubrobacteraceae bacterium]